MNLFYSERTNTSGNIILSQYLIVYCTVCACEGVEIFFWPVVVYQEMDMTGYCVCSFPYRDLGGDLLDVIRRMFKVDNETFIARSG